MSESTPPGQPTAPQLFCDRCGYDLRGITSSRCPECGQDVSAEAYRVSRIPWARCEGGFWSHFLAFWGTAWVALAAPQKLAAEQVRPVDFAKAARFRRLCLLHFWIFGVISFGLLPLNSRATDTVPLWLQMAFVLVGVWATADLATGLPLLFVRPSAKPVILQNRIAAAARYCSGTLVCTLPLVTIAWVVVPTMAWARGRGPVSDIAGGVAIFLLMGAGLLLWTTWIRFAWCLGGWWRFLGAIFVLPALWNLAAFVLWQSGAVILVAIGHLERFNAP